MALITRLGKLEIFLPWHHQYFTAAQRRQAQRDHLGRIHPHTVGYLALVESGAFDFLVKLGVGVARAQRLYFYAAALQLYQNTLEAQMRRSEQIYSIPEGDQVFHVYVPFVPTGEYVGAVYVKNTPDFTFITREIIISYDETALIFATLIILGLLAMPYSVGAAMFLFYYEVDAGLPRFAALLMACEWQSPLLYGLGPALLIWWIIDPKLRAVSAEYEAQQAAYIDQNEALTLEKAEA